MSTTSEVARLDRDDEDLQGIFTQRQYHMTLEKKVFKRAHFATELPQETVEGLRQIFFEKSTAAERYRYFAKRADSEGQVRAASYFRNLARSMSIYINIPATCHTMLISIIIAYIGESEHAQEIISAFEDATGVDPTTGEEIGNTFADLEASLVSEMHVSETNHCGYVLVTIISIPCI